MSCLLVYSVCCLLVTLSNPLCGIPHEIIVPTERVETIWTERTVESEDGRECEEEREEAHEAVEMRCASHMYSSGSTMLVRCIDVNHSNAYMYDLTYQKTNKGATHAAWM